MKNVYCLYRVSTKGQVDQNDIPMQKIACREFAHRNGWNVEKEFYEKGVSGYKVSSDDRDVLQDLKQAAQRHEFDVLLVYTDLNNNSLQAAQNMVKYSRRR